MAQIHRSVATLRVSGDALIPDEITKLLGAEPDDAHQKGDQLVGRRTGMTRIVKSGLWRLNASRREPENLDGQVQEILARLTDNLTVWTDISRRFEIDLFCGLFMKETNEGLTISADVLAALGQRGIEIGLDIYGPGDD